MAIESKRWEAFNRNVNRTETCWLWTGAKNGSGYGMFRLGRMGMAHRWVWQLAHGPIPEGMQIDHRCRVRLCVNPEHLDLVTRRRNLQRREFESWKAIDARVEGVDGKALTVTLSPQHSAWVRARAEDSGRSPDEIVGLAMYRYMARWIGGWAKPTRSAAE